MTDEFEAQLMPVTPRVGEIGIATHGSIITAQRVAVPRVVATVQARIKKLAHMAGEKYYYRWRVKKKTGGTDLIEGPSITCALDVAREWGNCVVDTRIVAGEDEWVIYARFVDLETGFSITRPFRQRRSQSLGGRYDEDRQLDIIFQIGVSKAIRNVIRNALVTTVDYAQEEAKQALVGKVENNPEKARAKLRERIEEMGIKLSNVERIVGRTIDKWLVPDMTGVIVELQSIGDGFADPDDLYPEPGAAASAAVAVDTETPVADKRATIDKSTKARKRAEEGQTTGVAERGTSTKPTTETDRAGDKEPPATGKRGRGRPAGSKNKPKAGLQTAPEAGEDGPKNGKTTSASEADPDNPFGFDPD